MNPNQPMVEADGKFIRGIGLIFQPVEGIVQEIPEFGRDLPGCNPDIPACRSKLARPTPNILKHPLVQMTNKGFRQDILMLAAESPMLGLQMFSCSAAFNSLFRAIQVGISPSFSSSVKGVAALSAVKISIRDLPKAFWGNPEAISMQVACIAPQAPCP